MQEVRRAFEVDGDGLRAVAARAAAVDEVVRGLWAEEIARDERLGVGGAGVALAAVGGYGRGQLFPYSDVDLLVCAAKPAAAKDAVRRISQALWDAGLQVALTTRAPKECERFDPANAEFGLALLDLRFVAGDENVVEELSKRLRTQRRGRDGRRILAELEKLVRERHGKYGETLFHLEPNIKDCPGGLRDTHVCLWVEELRGETAEPEQGEFEKALAFLTAVRCFLHWRHERDDNVLDWMAQDAAAARGVGLPVAREARRAVDAAYWMRVYFRHARTVERRLVREMESAGLRVDAARVSKAQLAAESGFHASEGRIELDAAVRGRDPAHSPDTVLRLFTAAARTGLRLAAATEERIEQAIPVLSNRLMEGVELWKHLGAILAGEGAGVALRTMHALGVLDLILPEFHGIDALVIRDAYHRYTVDEHTFVLIDTLHELERGAPAGATEWRLRLGAMIHELQNPALLYLAALLHDTGKGRAGDDHAAESSRLAESVLARLEMDPYDTAMVLQLIETHLEMSAALRRDIFDMETVRSFAGKVQTHESLKMLTLFTYADIRAVHPDALTPWKAENLWRLSMSTSNQLDRNVDQERVQTRGRAGSGDGERLARLLAIAAEKDRGELERFVEGLPERYLRTRPAEAIYRHFKMAERLDGTALELEMDWEPETTAMTLVSRDRPGLFAAMAAALAAWGMNVVTAEAFANAEGVVVDSFRFTDTFRTLELNESERGRFVESVREIVEGKTSAESMLSARRRGRRRSPKVVVETSVEFDDAASATSTLLQVVAQDVPGLLRAISLTLSQQGCNVEVALVDTEGETAIDVFYLTREGSRLTAAEKRELRAGLVGAIEQNAG
ncbi:MAG TPA: [protein-PII] uridylyltransferase [Acidobacteriaceae bacterium]|jgi:[protein-PII] uridylyltransferase|nr:[protein-PII] uridylyltransferase [Acidobacteriaceae bacterium]